MACFPWPQGGRGTQRRGGSCSPLGGAVEVEPFSGHCGWGFPGTSLRKSGLHGGPGHHSGVEHALLGREALRGGRGLGGGRGATCREPALGGPLTTLRGTGEASVPFWSQGGLKCSLGRPPAARSLGRALQQPLPLARVTEELQFPGEQLHLHGHRFVLLTVDAEGAPCALWKQQSAAAGLETLGALNMQLGVSHLFTSYSDEVSFADGVGFHADVHKVFFACQVQLTVPGCDGQLKGGQLHFLPDLWVHLLRGSLRLCPVGREPP